MGRLGAGIGSCVSSCRCRCAFRLVDDGAYTSLLPLVQRLIVRLLAAAAFAARPARRTRRPPAAAPAGTMRRASASPLLRALSRAPFPSARGTSAHFRASSSPLPPQAVRLVLRPFPAAAASPPAGSARPQSARTRLSICALALSMTLLRPAPAAGRWRRRWTCPACRSAAGRWGAASPRRTRSWRSPRPPCVRAIGLQLGIVGGGRAPARPCRRSILNDGDGQRRALHRVGARAQLVEQHQASGRPPASVSSTRCWSCAPRRWTGSARCSARRRCPPAPGANTLHGAAVRRRRYAGRTAPSGVSSPSVFSVTVLPPVLGPVMTSVSNVAAQRHRHRHRLGRIQQGVPRPPQVDAALRCAPAAARRSWL